MLDFWICERVPGMCGLPLEQQLAPFAGHPKFSALPVQVLLASVLAPGARVEHLEHLSRSTGENLKLPLESGYPPMDGLDSWFG